jgi:hypothetical protein
MKRKSSTQDPGSQPEPGHPPPLYFCRTYRSAILSLSRMSTNSHLPSPGHPPVFLTVVHSLLALCCASCGFRPANKFLIPEGYEGWVEVHYSVPDQPDLLREGDNLLIKVPTSGKMSTRTPLVSGYADDKYYFVSANGRKIEIPFEIHGCSSGVCISHNRYFWGPQQDAIFFVGSESDLSKFPEPQMEPVTQK